MTQKSTFQGFPKEGIAFLKNLERHNNRDWFQENKTAYEASIKEPAQAFHEAMSDELSALSGMLMGGKIVRIYRDIRFSKDKTPYHTYVRMSFSCQDDSNDDCGSRPVFCFSLEAKELIVGLGHFEFSKALMPVYQAAVADDATGKALEKIMANMNKKGYRIDGPEYKRVPKGYDPDHPRGDLLRRKGLNVWSDAPHPKELATQGLVKYCMKQYRSMLPMYRWLDAL